MITFNRSLRLLAEIAIVLLLVSYISMFGLPAFSAIAAPEPLFVAQAYQDTHLTKEDSNISKARTKRIDAVAECRKYLAKGDKDTVANLDRPLDKMGNDRVVGALKTSDRSEPTEAEVAFKRCLEEQQVAPTPSEADRKNRPGESGF